MTPSEYNKIEGLNALGGCAGTLCIFIIYPILSAIIMLTMTGGDWPSIGQFLAGCGIGGVIVFVLLMVILVRLQREMPK